MVTSLSNGYFTKLKAFLSVMDEIVFNTIENTVRKGEKNGYTCFLLS